MNEYSQKLKKERNENENRWKKVIKNGKKE